MKQADIAQAVGVSQQFISALLLGRKRPGRNTAAKLEQATGVPFKTWMLGTPDEIKAALAGSGHPGQAGAA